MAQLTQSRARHLADYLSQRPEYGRVGQRCGQVAEQYDTSFGTSQRLGGSALLLGRHYAAQQSLRPLWRRRPQVQGRLGDSCELGGQVGRCHDMFAGNSVVDGKVHRVDHKHFRATQGPLAQTVIDQRLILTRVAANDQRGICVLEIRQGNT